MILLIVSSLLYGGQKIVHKVTSDRVDPIIYAMWWFFGSAVFSIPLLFSEPPQIPQESSAYLGVLLSVALWALAGYTGFLSYRYLEVSLRIPLSRVRLLFTVILSALLLGEAVTLVKIISIGLILIAALLPLEFSLDRQLAGQRNKGIILTITSVFCMSLGYLVDKEFSPLFGQSFFLVIQYTFLFLVFWAFQKRGLGSLARDVGKNVPWLLLSAAMNVGYYYLMLKS